MNMAYLLLSRPKADTAPDKPYFGEIRRIDKRGFLGRFMSGSNEYALPPALSSGTAGLRGRGPASELHQGGPGAERDPGRGQPPGARARGAAGPRPLPAHHPPAGPDAGRPAAAARGDRGLRDPAPGPCRYRARRAGALHHHDTLLRRALAGTPPRALRRAPSGYRADCPPYPDRSRSGTRGA